MVIMLFDAVAECLAAGLCRDTRIFLLFSIETLQIIANEIKVFVKIVHHEQQSLISGAKVKLYLI